MARTPSLSPMRSGLLVMPVRRAAREAVQFGVSGERVSPRLSWVQCAGQFQSSSKRPAGWYGGRLRSGGTFHQFGQLVAPGPHGG